MGGVTVDPQRTRVTIRDEAFGKIRIQILLRGTEFLFFPVLAGNFAVACLNAFFLHGQRSVHLVRRSKGVRCKHSKHVCLKRIEPFIPHRSEPVRVYLKNSIMKKKIF